MLTIRLSRTGKKHKPQYRIVVQDKRRDPWSPAIDIVGHYNPHTKPSTITLKEDRIKHWLEKGAQPSNTVHNMLVNAGVINDKKTKSITLSKKRVAKIEEKTIKNKEAEEKKKAEAKAKIEEDKKEEQEAKAKKEEKPEKDTTTEENQTKEEKASEEK